MPHDASSLLDELHEQLWNDPLVYWALSLQVQEGLSDRDTLIRLVKQMAERDKRQSEQIKNLIEHSTIPLYVGSIGV